MSMIHEDQVQQAKEIVTAHNRATPTMLERLMKVHYQTAVTLLEELQRLGAVGPGLGNPASRAIN